MTSENRESVLKVGEVTLHQLPNGKAVAQGPFAIANKQVRVAANVASQNLQVAGQNISRRCAQISVEEVHAQVGNIAAHTVTEPKASRPSPNESILPGALSSSERGVEPHTSQVPVISHASQNVGRSLSSKAEIGGTSYPPQNRHLSPRASPSQDPLPITNGERELVLQTPRLTPTMQDGANQVIERSGAASKQAVGLKVEEVQLKTGNIAIGKLRGEAIVEKERKVVRQAAEFTDDGRITYRQYETTERVFYCRIIEIMYIAALNEPEVPPEPTATEKCIDCCCQSIHCNICKLCQSFTKRSPKDTKSAFNRIEYMTPILRRARSKGWVMHKELIPDIIKESCRNWWVSFQLCTVIVALVLSIVTFSLGKNRIFNILHLVLTLLGSILSITDGLFNLCGCGLLKKCRVCCKHVPENNDDESLSAQYMPLRDQEAAVTEAARCEKCKKRIANTRSIFDLSRMVLSEVLIYPILICNIFELIIGKAYKFSNVTDGISFTLFAISSVSLFFYVYIVKLIILIVANIQSQKKCRPMTKDDEQMQSQDSDYDPAIRKAAKYLQCYFIYHVAVQMLAQILMIIAIGAKIQDDNSHLFEDEVNDDTIHVSGTLWYMLVAGYVLPIFGLLTFFVVTYFWVQEFPIGFCIDCLCLLKTPGINNLVDFGETKEKVASKIERINGYIDLSDLTKDFKDLRQKARSDKFGYPFKTPQMVIICLIYAFLQLSFIICAGISTSGNGPLGGGYWGIFYFIAVIVGFIANFHVFLVALFWSAIIMFVIAFIAILLSLIIFCCLIMACVSSPSNNNRQRY